MLEKKSALIKILLFYGEMSVMTRAEYNLLCKDYGFVNKNDLAYYKTYVVLIFYPNSNKSTGKLSVFDVDGYTEIKKFNDAVKKIQETIVYLKELEYLKKVTKMNEDFE